jgi:hypothetical protein
MCLLHFLKHFIKKNINIVVVKKILKMFVKSHFVALKIVFFYMGHKSWIFP